MMTRRAAMLLPLAVLAAFASAETPRIDFDGALDAGGFLRQAREASLERRVPLPAVRAGGIEYDRDCAVIAFEPAGPALSEPVTLVSQGYIEECRWVPGGPDGRGGWRDCWRRPGWTNRERVQVEILGRKPVLPWERERFQACLEGQWLTLRSLAAAYDYKIGRQGGLFTLTPGRKTPMDPDPAGISAGSPANTGAGLSLVFSDRWASHYGAGEKTVLHVEVFREIEGWFDPLLAEGDVVLDTAPAYAVDFAVLGASLESGKTYYAKWGFRRRGSVSKDTLIRRGETERAVFIRAPAQS